MLVNGKEILEKCCTNCNQVKEIGEFSVTKRNEDGSIKYVASWCKGCKAEKELEKRGGRVKPLPVITEDSKECLDCHTVKHVSEFSPAKRGRLGVSAYCKPCASERVKRDPNYHAKHREHTKAYRTRHSSRWKAMHRIHQFNRKSRIKATDDGTVDDVVLDLIYRLVHCYWCKKETVPEERTLEHVEELSEGGEHTLNNVAMACLSCNSARKGRKCNSSKENQESKSGSSQTQSLEQESV